MKLGITGSTEYKDYEAFQQVVDAIPVPITLIVTGGREGVEAMARRYAKLNSLSILIHHAKPLSEGIQWLHKRNILLVNDCDNLLCFGHVGTHLVALLKSLAGNLGRKIKVVYLEGHGNPQAVASRYGETI